MERVYWKNNTKKKEAWNREDKKEKKKQTDVTFFSHKNLIKTIKLHYFYIINKEIINKKIK